MCLACLSQVWLLQGHTGEPRHALARGPHLCAVAPVSLSDLKHPALVTLGFRWIFREAALLMFSLLLVWEHSRGCLSPSHSTPISRPQTTPGDRFWFPIPPWPLCLLLFLIGLNFHLTAPILFLTLSISSDLLKVKNLHPKASTPRPFSFSTGASPYLVSSKLTQDFTPYPFTQHICLQVTNPTYPHPSKSQVSSTHLCIAL